MGRALMTPPVSFLLVLNGCKYNPLTIILYENVTLKLTSTSLFLWSKISKKQTNEKIHIIWGLIVERTALALINKLELLLWQETLNILSLCPLCIFPFLFRGSLQNECVWTKWWKKRLSIVKDNDHLSTLQVLTCAIYFQSALSCQPAIP